MFADSFPAAKKGRYIYIYCAFRSSSSTNCCCLILQCFCIYVEKTCYYSFFIKGHIIPFYSIYLYFSIVNVFLWTVCPCFNVYLFLNLLYALLGVLLGLFHVTALNKNPTIIWNRIKSKCSRNISLINSELTDYINLWLFFESMWRFRGPCEAPSKLPPTQSGPPTTQSGPLRRNQDPLRRYQDHLRRNQSPQRRIQEPTATK